jgi:hypothetical protein
MPAGSQRTSARPAEAAQGSAGAGPFDPGPETGRSAGAPATWPAGLARAADLAANSTHWRRPTVEQARVLRDSPATASSRRIHGRVLVRCGMNRPRQRSCSTPRSGSGAARNRRRGRLTRLARGGRRRAEVTSRREQFDRRPSWRRRATRWRLRRGGAGVAGERPPAHPFAGHPRPAGTGSAPGWCAGCLGGPAPAGTDRGATGRFGRHRCLGNPPVRSASPNVAPPGGQVGLFAELALAESRRAAARRPRSMRRASSSSCWTRTHRYPGRRTRGRRHPGTGHASPRELAGEATGGGRLRSPAWGRRSVGRVSRPPGQV